MGAIDLSFEHAARSQAAAAAARSTGFPADAPGRWIGGLIGALFSLVAAGLGPVMNQGQFSQPAGTTAIWGAAATIAALGIPIAWILGRHLLPTLRTGG